MATEETKPVAREATFKEIMGSDMPDYESAEYERWLFDQTWDAAQSQAFALVSAEGITTIRCGR